MIKPNGGNFVVEWYPKAASTAFTDQDIVALDASGYVTPATANTTLNIGAIQKTIASTDSDYASNTFVPVLIPQADAEWLCDVGTGSAAQTNVGEWVDLKDANELDVTASSVDAFFVTRIVSTTKVVAKMAKKSGAAA